MLDLRFNMLCCIYIKAKFMVITNKILSIIREEVEKMNNIFNAEYVANHIFFSLEQDEDSELTFQQYHQKIKMFGNEYELVEVDPNTLRGFAKDWDSNSVETYEYMFNNNIKVPEIVIDEQNKIIDGSNRATAAMLKKKRIMAFKVIKR